jgi:alkanesulfonate monooxygenase SsuD/methylene tetrahydromethanopterin reductase-like flavin-dependent oxidoreductase (luciferase family)
LASLDLLSGKRIAFGAGLGGAPDEFSAFGEPADAKQRAARWDGWLAPATSHDGTPTMAKSPERIAEIRRHRTTEAPFEVAVDGYSEPGDPRLPRSYGATWWLESIHNVRGPQGEMMARVKAGPPEAE